MTNERSHQALTDSLGTFRRVLAREAHVLTHRPDLLWQQFFNRLKWENGPIKRLLGPHLGKRVGPGATPWIRARLPLPESEALIRTLQIPHPAERESRVSLCAFTPDGSRVVSQDFSWDAETGKEVPPIFERSDGGWVCGVSKDHDRVITVDGFLCKAWETRSGREIATCSAHDFQATSPEALSAMGDYFLRACAVSPDGTRVVTGVGKSYAIWNADTGDVVTRTAGNSYLPGCAFSPDGRRVATTDDKSRCTILALDDDGRESDRVTFEIPEGLMTACAFSPDGTRLVTGTTEGPAIIWHTVTGERSATLLGHSGAVFCCAFSPDGSKVLTGGKDGSARLWDADTGGERAVLIGHTRGVAACTFSPNSTRIATVQTNGFCRLWSMPRKGLGITDGRKRPPALALSSGGVQAMAFQFHAPKVASAFQDRCKIWDLKTGGEIGTVEGNRGRILSMAFSPGGERLALGTGDRVSPSGYVEPGGSACAVWDVEKGEEESVLEGHTGGVTSCAFGPEADWIVTGGGDFVCRVWDLSTSEVVSVSEKHATPVAACAVNPNGTRVASTSSGACKIWDPATGRGIGSLYGHKGDVRACAFSPDGSRIVTGSGDKTCKIWDTESRRELMTLRGHGGSIEDCTFTPDGTLVISAGNDRTLRVWNSHSGDCIGTFPLMGESRGVAHDPGGAFWTCADTSGAVYLTDLVGAGLGPFSATPVDRGKGPQVRCPICNVVFPLDEAWLGTEITCLSDTCSGRLRLNPFCIDRSPLGKRADWVRTDSTP